MDTLSAVERSERMRRVKGADTAPELIVRRLLHRLGFRFRLHRRDLPGTPDIVLPAKRIIVLVHGCFWHRHRNCALARIPKSRTKFWIEKLEGNRLRDEKNLRRLRKLGWRVCTIWECQVASESVRRKLLRFLRDE